MRLKLMATLMAAMSALLVLAGPAAAQDVATVEDVALVQFNLDVVFFMLAAGLVFWMQAGFSMLETGMTRSKNAANIMMKNMADACFGIIAYFLLGFGLMYGASAGGFIGTDTFALSAGSYSELGLYGGDSFLAADFIFQAVFAATAATIVSGAVAGRMKFSGYLIVTLLMTTLIYPIVGHWKWGGGWLDSLGFYDFAGSTLVHMTGGVAALVIAGILGPRIGKFAKDGKPRAIPGHSMPLATLGMFALFWGWFGFNGGSVLAADGSLVGPVLLTTTLAGCAGGGTAMVYTWLRYGKPDIGMTINGVLAGLVGITAGADQVGAIAALVIGVIAGVLVALAVPAVDRLGIDDAVGAFSVHGVNGAWGTLAVGIWANTGEEGLTGLWHGGGAGLLVDQLIGVVAVSAFVAVCAAALAFALKATNLLRVSEAEEIEGLDIHEHGMYGYPEAALGASAYPGGPVTAPTGEVAVSLPAADARSEEPV
ncbi:Ammonium transporter [Euzebya pacifica]|uniref:Ammonium transporter n=2 Tax=Euzebya pacifica TaxID=1608957 RepID=A0A346XXH1_9ACTN|nr:Ammonium transporter [Euzebya pacifica]